MDNVKEILTFCCSTALIFGGLVPYIPQYLKIKRTLKTDGFSTYVCLTLLLANILRIAFWFGHRFELPLLIQSFVIITGMLALMEICIRVRNKRSACTISAIGNANSLSHTVNLLDERVSNTSEKRFRIGSGGDFWDWDDFPSYLKFLTLFSLLVGLLTYLLIDNEWYISSLGFVALFTESMLGIPQVIRNHIKKSTRGMSVEMVIMWLSGDLFKTLYYVVRQLPTQFYVCGTLQVMIDILILVQVFLYRPLKANYRRIPRTT